MAPRNIRLVYFDTRGRAEVIRLVLAAVGQPYEDIRLSPQTWDNEKGNTPFGQLPCLEIDGVSYGQTVAIVNYLAREFGLYGKNNEDALNIDQVVQLVQDAINVIITAVFQKDEAKKVECVKHLKEIEIPKYLSFLEVLLQKNGGGHFVGSSLTLADILVFDFVDTMKLRNLGTIDVCPAIQELVKNVENNDKIKTYLSTRKNEI